MEILSRLVILENIIIQNAGFMTSSKFTYLKDKLKKLRQMAAGVKGINAH